jgi:RNA polymerase primary sigma factor
MAWMTKTNYHGPDCTRPAPHDIPKGGELSRDEENELAGLIAQGDHDARDRLVLANLGLAVAIAGDFRHRGLEMDDWVGEGNLGLIRAAEKFDPSFGSSFGTYARYWIKEKILAALMNTGQTIRIPAHTCRLLLKWRRAEKLLGIQLGRMPNFQDVAAVLDLSPVQKTTVSHALASQLKTKEPGGSESSTHSVDKLRDRGSSCEDMADWNEERVIARHRMDRLKVKERAVVSMRYGLETERLTLEAVGLRLGLTKEGVRRIEVRAMRKLKEDHGH